MRNGGCGNSMVFKTPIEIGHLLIGCVRKLKLFERLSIKINYWLFNGIHSKNMLTKKRLINL
jgi:hypothetical protein